jgi:hypothetical protein
MVVLGRMPVSALRSTALLLEPLPGTCPASTSVIDNSFKGRGFQFIPIRPAHLDFVAWAMGREAPDYARVFGAALVDKDFIPLGVALAYFEDECISLHASFGKWLKIYPKDILRHMSGFLQALRDKGHQIAYACADESVEGSTTLIEWLKGEPTGKRHAFGEIYRIDLTRTKI